MACSHWWLPCDSLVALTASILIMTLFVSLCAGKQDHQSPASLSSLPSNQSFLFLNYFNWASVFGSLFINLSIFLLISLPLISYIYISKMVSLEVVVAGVSSHLLPNTRMTSQFFNFSFTSLLKNILWARNKSWCCMTRCWNYFEMFLQYNFYHCYCTI